MVVTHLYGYIDKQTDGIDRHGDRHKDREILSREKQYIPMPICLDCLEFVACRFGLFVSLWFGSVVRLIGSDFLLSIKKFFNFPNFFSNYLIFNAFQI